MQKSAHEMHHQGDGVETTVFAANNLVQPQTARKRYSQTGSYHGVKPVKLASGRLLWPDVIVTVRGAIAANNNTSVAAVDDHTTGISTAELKSKADKVGRHG